MDRINKNRGRSIFLRNEQPTHVTYQDYEIKESVFCVVVLVQLYCIHCLLLCIGQHSTRIIIITLSSISRESRLDFFHRKSKKEEERKKKRIT